MGDVVLMEIIEDMDSDLDGAVNLEEYLADIVTDEDEENIIEHERNNFSDNLDLDKNGVLDKEEVILNPTSLLLQETLLSPYRS